MQPESPADGDRYQLTAILLRYHRRTWRLMWIGEKDIRDRDIRAATLAEAADKASNIVAELYRGSPASATTDFMLFLFGRRTLVYDKGPQLIVSGEPGQLTATDEPDESELHGATLDDLLTAAGGDPAAPGDYGIRWARPVSALLEQTPDWT